MVKRLCEWKERLLPFSQRETENAQRKEKERIRAELDQILKEMQVAESVFNQSADDALTESGIYAMNALDARYRYWYAEACRVEAENHTQKEHCYVKMDTHRLRRAVGDLRLALVDKMQKAFVKHPANNRAQ